MAIIYSSTNDGYLYGSAVTSNAWAAVRSAATGNGGTRTSQTGINAVATSYTSGRGSEVCNIYRSFFEFNVSGITSEVADCTLNIYGYYQGNNDVIVVRGTQDSTLSTNDWDAIYNSSTELAASDSNGAGTLAGVSGLTYSAEVSTWSTTGYNSITLNSTALQDLEDETTFKVVVMDYDYDYLDNISLGTSFTRTGMWYANYTGTSRDPYIEYNLAGASGYGNTIMGIASGNISAVNGIATADVSKVNGV